MKTKNRNQIFYDQYVVKLSYQKDDGFWVHGHEQFVQVPLTNPIKEKKLHQEAERMVLEMPEYRGRLAKVTSVRYL